MMRFMMRRRRFAAFYGGMLALFAIFLFIFLTSSSSSSSSFSSILDLPLPSLSTSPSASPSASPSSARKETAVSPPRTPDRGRPVRSRPSPTPDPTPWVAPTDRELGLTQLGGCAFDPDLCGPPFLHLLNTVQGREASLARLLDSFLRHRDAQEAIDLRCVCLGVAHLVKPNASLARTSEGEDLVAQLVAKWPGPHMVVRWEGPYNRVLTYEKLVSHITTPPEESLIFSMDVDLIFKAGFLPTLKDTVVRGETFYSPIFWIFDEQPKNMTDAQVIEEPKGLVIVNNTKGFWYKTSYGMMSFYKSDFLRGGGFREVVKLMIKTYKHSDLTLWGNEDWAMRDVLRSVGLKEIRRYVPEIIHMYHPKDEWQTKGERKPAPVKIRSGKS